MVELGLGIRIVCRIKAATPVAAAATPAASPDLSALSSMLKARWKGDTKQAAAPATLRVGQIASFRIAILDRDAKKIELETA